MKSAADFIRNNVINSDKIRMLVLIMGSRLMVNKFAIIQLTIVKLSIGESSNGKKDLAIFRLSI